MGNVVFLKDSYNSLILDSYDLIPTLEAVYGKQKSCFYLVSEGKMSNTQNIFSVIRNSSKFSYFYFYNGFS